MIITGKEKGNATNDEDTKKGQSTTNKNNEISID